MVVNRQGLGIKGEGTWHCTRILHPFIIPPARPATGPTAVSEPFYTLKRALSWTKCTFSITQNASVHVTGASHKNTSTTCKILKRENSLYVEWQTNIMSSLRLLNLFTENYFFITPKSLLNHSKMFRIKILYNIIHFMGKVVFVLGTVYVRTDYFHTNAWQK